ncbi:MAG: SPFH domain-containing protein [Clostridia bacterium]|nr:SPFH domain-containing protein [Clostridia bacterium]
MGLIKAGLGALGGTLADTWKEFFYCDALPVEVLVRKGQKRISGRSSNTKASDNIISNGSGIAVADGQCMIIVEQGKVVDVCAEPGEYTYDSSTEPSIFAGSLGKSIIDTFKTIGKRFTYGGDTGKDQRVYYFNTKEIIGNKFGTPSPIMFLVKNMEVGLTRTVQVRCNGIYAYQITNPLLFYTKYCGNVEDEYRREEIDETLKIDFVDALQPALGELSAMGIRPDELSAKARELKAAMNNALRAEWVETRGISIGKIALNPITLTPEDMKKINEIEEATSYGSNPFKMAGRMTTATADAMETAAGNTAGAMTGFMGMGMAGGAMGGGFNSAQQLYNMGVQQQSAQQPQIAQQPAINEPSALGSWKCSCGAVAGGKFCTECGAKKPEADGWTCACGTVNKGKFCAECGAKKPAGIPLYKCDKCGWEPEDPKNPPKFCPECGDRFDDGDIK